MRKAFVQTVWIIMIVTKEELRKAATDKGGYRKAQVLLGQKITKSKHWKKNIIGKVVDDETWLKFVGAKDKKKRKNKPKVMINSFSVASGWEWKPETCDIPEPKFKKGKNNKNQGRKKQNRRKISTLENSIFYNSREWRELRVRALEKYECKCAMCGRSPKIHGIVIHVDHIKPRSKYPELSLDFNNLQLLCEDCNLGKSNKFETDWR